MKLFADKIFVVKKFGKFFTTEIKYFVFFRLRPCNYLIAKTSKTYLSFIFKRNQAAKLIVISNSKEAVNYFENKADVINEVFSI